MKKSKTPISTLLDIVRWGENAFEHSDLYFGHGSDNAWDEALLLALHVLKIPLDADPAVLQQKLSDFERDTILELYRRRLEERIPVPYLIHEAHFAGLTFYVDERVLIPRSPFAELIEEQFQPWIDANQVKQILDIGTGSACMAIAAAYYFPHAEVDAIDISSDVLAVAKINVERHALVDRVHLIQSDCFQALQGKRYDIIMANPPYVAEEEWQTLPQEYYHEPRDALVAKEEGLAIVLRILREAKNFMNERGILCIEMGNTAEWFQEKYPEIPGIWLEFSRGGDGVLLLTEAELSGI